MTYRHAVRRAKLFRHNAFAAKLTCGSVHGRAVLIEMLIKNDAQIAAFKQLFYL
jgi:hypothetical protein